MTTFTTQDRLEARIQELEAQVEALKQELNERFDAGKALGYAEGLASMSGMSIKGAAL